MLTRKQVFRECNCLCLSQRIAKIEQKLASWEKHDEETTYSIGDRFINSSGEKCILVAVFESIFVSNRVMFADLSTGHGDSIRVGNCNKITPEEMSCHLAEYNRYWDSQRKIYTGDKKGKEND